MYTLSDYDYDLPEERIAQVPCRTRSGSRLMRIQKERNRIDHCRFDQLADLLRDNDLLVVNNTRVIPARLLGNKETGGKVEVLIIDYAAGIKHLETHGSFQCECLVKASKNPRPGARLYFGREITAEVVAVRGGISEIRFSGGDTFLEYMRESGRLPLPPYIKRGEDTALLEQDRENYQTVYADKEGAVAAPTAGLHFTGPLMNRLAGKGIELAQVTLHVGYGTFVPVRVDDIRDHQIHSEFFSLAPETAEQINRAKDEGRRVVAVGTTSVRTLEFLADEAGRVKPETGMCDLYIYPGYTYRCVDAMITNFHLPKSTLLMLVSAFYDRERIIRAYEAAVAEGYRFFSYGDAMLIE